MKKGFTLIELLAVIVILAIIALIATPSILNVIEKSRKGSAESSALGYIDAVEKKVIIEELNNNILKDGIYGVTEIDVDLKGMNPIDGWFLIKQGQIKNYSLKFDDYSITSINNVKKIEKGDIASKPVCILESGDIFAVGSKYECYMAPGIKQYFYLLSVDEETSNVRLLLDRNYHDDVVPELMTWCIVSKDNDNSCNHDNLNQYVEYLEGIWKNVDVDIPSAQELAFADGYMIWSSDDYQAILSSLWMIDNFTNSYWTSTKLSTHYTISVQKLKDKPYLNNSWVNNEWIKNGLRPVISIQKEKVVN